MTGKAELMATRYEPKDLEAITAQLEHENPRVVIIVGGSLIEYALEELIKSRLREPVTSDDRAKLLSETGIVGSFEQNIVCIFHEINRTHCAERFRFAASDEERGCS